MCKTTELLNCKRQIKELETKINELEKQLEEKVTPTPPATLTKQKVIEELEFDILIHEHWAVKVTQEPEWAETMGDYSWHMRWIEVYKNCLRYMKEKT